MDLPTLEDPRRATLTPVGSFCALQVLKLPNNGIKELMSLIRHPYLHTLDLSNNALKSRKGLESTSLRHLDVSGNSLTALDQITKVPGLTTIHAANNQITKVGAGKYAGVSSLNLAGNCMEDLSCFADPKCDFPALESLNLEKNKLPGYGELKHIGQWWDHATPRMPNLTKLCIADQQSIWMNPGEEDPPFDDAKHPVMVLVYMPGLTALDQLPLKTEEEDIPFGTAEQLEEAEPLRTEAVEAEKAAAEEARLAAEAAAAAKKAAEEAEAAREAAEEAED